MKKLFLLISIALYSIVCFTPNEANAQYTQLTDFTGNGAIAGSRPMYEQNLISIGGVMYGMTYQGGTNGLGTIFKIMPNGTGYVRLFDFAAATGKYPYGSLIFDGTFLYGMTYSGGLTNRGVIFKILPDGTGYLKLYDFVGATNGSNPYGSLIFDGTFLYGMTERGGINDMGVIFKIIPDGTGYVKLLDFAGASNGSIPYGSLFSDGTFLYGMTKNGGTNNAGTIFKIMPDGTGYVKLLDFAGLNAYYPYGSLISDGTFIYGMTSGGGMYSQGTIFKILPDGTGYVKLLDFTGSTNGKYPYGSLIFDGTFLYGMTKEGGTNNFGTVFKIMPDGTGYVKLLDFDGTANGSYPYGSLFSDGTFLYGMTKEGGTNNLGTIFKIMPDGTGYLKLLEFVGAAKGCYPTGSLISDGTYLYGMTSHGGINNDGVVFKIMPDGTGYVKLLDFTYSLTGSRPRGSLIFDGTFLYGMTWSGGTNNYGTIFKIMPDGTGYVKLLDFAGVTNGGYPDGSLLFDGTFLYGTTAQGGTNNYGTIFKIMPDGTGYVKLLEFAGTNGRNPTGSLFFEGTFLYGTTVYGGTNNMGTVFKILPDGTGYVKLLDFAGAINGSNPYGSLFSDGTFLYGTTAQGGINDSGTVFKIMPDGTGYVKLLDFTGLANGSNPCGSLIFDGTFLYGMTFKGGADSLGTIFKLMTDGTGFVKLFDFAGVTNGSYPYGSLISVGTFLYGMTVYGGTENVGTVFKYCIPATFSQSPIVCPGQSFTVGANTYTASGTYTDSLISINGCDSIVTTNLTVSPVITVSQSLTICSGQSITVGLNIYNISGTYSDSLIAMGGCDSIVTTNLTVLPANTFSQFYTICPGQSIAVGANNYNISGTYTDTLTSIYGCDSIVTTNLTVLLPNTFSQSPIVCAGQSITVGANTYTNSGTYIDSLTSINGCDSTVTTTLTVLPAITNSVTIVSPTCGNNNGSATVSPAGGAGNFTFLWSNGDTTATVTGLTGSPADTLIVLITDANGCTLTDNVIVNCVTGVNEWAMENQPLIIYPNPNSGQFIITTKEKQSEINIINTLGEIIFTSTINQQTSTIDISNQPSGIYFLKLKSANGIERRKIIKQ